jgi:hypothetical protein
MLLITYRARCVGVKFYPNPTIAETFNLHGNGTQTKEDCTSFWNMMYQGLGIYLSVALAKLGVQEHAH